MHEIAPLSELNRRTANKSTPPTRSPSPYGGPLLDTPQAGGLSPPPPSHYLRDKARTGGTQESIARLKKRSEIYERSRRSRTPGSPSLSREELLAQQERQLSWASGSPLLNRSRAGSENLGDDSQTLDLTPLSFLSTDPMSGSTGGSRSLQDDVSSPLVTMYSEAGLTVETGSADSHFPSSFRGTRRATHSHRLTKSGSSLSTLSSASSNLFPLSVDPHIGQFPSTDATALPPYSNQPSSPNFRHHDCTLHSCTCNEKLHSPPHSANTLFDVQKRRRAQAFNQFTSYTEALPYHRSEQRTANGDLGMDSTDPSADRTLHANAEALLLRASSTGVDHISEKPQRKNGRKLILGLKHMLSPKGTP